MPNRHPSVAAAVDVATRDLRACYTDDGIIAGLRHFYDLWARDCLFACLGALSLGDVEIVRSTLKTLAVRQRADGLIPYVVRRGPMSLQRYYGQEKRWDEPRPEYEQRLSRALVPDGSLLFPIVLRRYVEHTGNNPFLFDLWPALVKNMGWCLSRLDDKGLFVEGKYCEWMDSVGKQGNTLWSNILLQKMLRDMQWLAVAGNRADVKVSIESASQTHQVALLHFFYPEDGRFVDWIDDKNKAHLYLASHSQLLALNFGLLPDEKALSILDYIEQNCLADFTVHSNHPRYPWHRVSPINILGGVADYQNQGCLWLQPGILYARALALHGKPEEARTQLDRIAKRIVNDGSVHEVFEPTTGKPLERFFYQSETPFAWSAGLFLDTAKAIGAG